MTVIERYAALDGT